MTSFVKIKSTIVALCVLCGIIFAQSPIGKPMAAVYVKGNPQGREVLMMAVNTFLVKTGIYQMIAVDAIDVVAREQNRQMSGSVSDNDIAKLGLDAGAQYVCVVERTEIDGVSYVTTSMVSVQSKIAEFSDMKELPRGEKVISVIERQINAMLGLGSGEGGGGYEAVLESVERQRPYISEKPSSTATYLRVNGQTENVSVSFGRSGGTKTLTVGTDGGDYEITFLPGRCSAKKYGTSFSLTCAQKDMALSNDDWFNVTSGDKTVKVSIAQDVSGGASSYSSSGGKSRSQSSVAAESKREKGQSIGIGAFFASDFGGGITWDDDDGEKRELVMPYYGGGFLFFWDWIYLEWFAGYQWGGGEWKYGGGSGGASVPEMWRTYVNYGVFGKFPLIHIGSIVRLFPLYGIDYEKISTVDTTGTVLKLPGGKDVIFDWGKGDNDDNDHLSGKLLDVLWGKFGGGIDIGNGDSKGYFFLRIEALYGIRLMANDFEKRYAANYIKDIVQDSGASQKVKPIPGRGLTVRISIGFQ